MKDEDIVLQPSEGMCAHAAIINLLRLLGRPAPSFAEIESGFQVLRQIPPFDEGVTQPQRIAQMLSAHGLLCGVVIIPPALWRKPQQLLTRFLDEGRYLLLFFNWKDGDKIINHGTIAEGYTNEGYACIDSDGMPPGSRIELEPKFTEAEVAVFVARLKDNPHGSRVVLPYYEVGVMPHSPLGLSPNVIVVWHE